MTPSRRPPQRQSGSDTNRVLIPDGGGKEPEGEDWKWNPAVDEEPVIESSDESDGGGAESPDGDQETPEEFPSRPQRPHRQWPDDEQASPASHQSGQTNDDPRDEQTESANNTRISRRALLLGGGGVVGAAALTGNWLVNSGGPTGAKAVAQAYLDAIAANDWERAGRLYHEAAGPSQAIERDNDTDDYESYLATNNRLEIYEALDPTVNSITVLKHFPDLNAETAGQSFLMPEDPSGLDAWKQLAVIVTIDTETLSAGRRRESEADALAGDRTNELILMGTVSEDGEWFLWDTTGQL